jgi:uncharacterized membrane protein YcjF (UPF0283 family)
VVILSLNRSQDVDETVNVDDQELVFRKKKMFNNYLSKILHQAYDFEKSSKHPLTETYFKHVKSVHKKVMKKRSFASTLIVFVAKCIIDSLWMTFLG